ncbi:MAG TPA: YhjD/YihY/BrkB family envelope integrity protein, partial [Burkholderiaceae bacterium]|nr:YhjD/YihY/BrkB family envelope integrity protein [Burkholderiaceae bacterium]
MNRLNRPAGALTQFVRRRVQRARTRMGKQLGRWSQRMERWLEPSRIRAFALRAREVLEFAVRRARQLRLPQVAGSLTFTTVLALVPLLAVALAIFATFPMFSEFRAALEKNLLRELLPTEHASVLLTYLGGFAKKAGQLTALGLMFLVVAAMLMI